jgi:hypothetical protein
MEEIYRVDTETRSDYILRCCQLPMRDRRYYMYTVNILYIKYVTVRLHYDKKERQRVTFELSKQKHRTI